MEEILNEIYAIGAEDLDIDLFESQYPVEKGVSYNSYVIMDEKIAVMDTIDKRRTEQWLQNLQAVLNGTAPDYLVVLHMEPDHSANIEKLSEMYPDMKLVGNARTFTILDQFFFDKKIAADRRITVKENDTLPLGHHTLQFIMAPMIHWPEVMMAYEQSEHTLFSADAFGRFGVPSLTMNEPWDIEARRYYYNIVGKYGNQVQSLLKKASALQIDTICPLHGPVLHTPLDSYFHFYDIWSQDIPEIPDGVLIATASIHGHTRDAMHQLATILKAKGIDVKEIDLTRTDVSYAVSAAFQYGRIILAACTYDANLFPAMEAFLSHLETKNLHSRRIGLVENGSWAPQAAKLMKNRLDTMKDMQICDTVLTIHSALHHDDLDTMHKLADELTA